MKAYSTDLRVKILAAVDDGMPKLEAARVFRVGISTVKRYAQQRQRTGTLEPKRHPGPAPKIAPAQRAFLRTQAIAHPAAFLDEHCALWEAQTGVRVTVSTMS